MASNVAQNPLELDSLLAGSRALVEVELNNLLPLSGTAPEKIHHAIRWSVFAGGKRFRPALLLAVGQAFSAPVETLIRTACAFEMVHTYSLIHDDLPAMDDDDLRRGRPTCHVRFDEATAILAGDALQTLAFQTIAEDVRLDAETRIALIAELGARGSDARGNGGRTSPGHGSGDTAGKSRTARGNSSFEDGRVNSSGGALRRDHWRRERERARGGHQLRIIPGALVSDHR